MHIVEDDEEHEEPNSTPSDYDFASLIIPNKIRPSKLSQLKSNFMLNQNGHQMKRPEPDVKSKERKDSAELIIPNQNSKSKSKITEYRNGVIIEEL